MSLHRSLLPLILLLLLASCAAPASIPSAAPPPSPTPPPLPTPTPFPPPTETETPSAPTPAPARPRYTLDASLDYATKTVQVEQRILYPNHTGETLDGLVLAVVPNLWPGGFTLESLSVDGAPLSTYTLQGQRLDLALPAPLPPEATLILDLRYRLDLPFAEQRDPNEERPRIYGYTARQVNLTNWYPFIVPYADGEGWVLHDPWYYGEHLVYEAADYEVTLRVSDPNVVVAASGAAEPTADGATRYTLTAGRAFAFSASPEFQVARAEVEGVTVASYYFPFYENPGQAALEAASQAVRIFGARYGPYPHPTLAAVMGDFNDGMEYSAFFFLPRDFYNLYDGTPKNYLTFVAAHETAHQWWFERVANDQALQPWLDEALCTYSERLFYEATDPALVSWWWAYRVDFYQPQGWVDIPVYEGGGFRPYTNAVYFRGAYFLEDLRARIGDEVFFAFLSDYLTQEDGRIARADDFFRILRAHTDADFSDLLREYFRATY